MIITKNYLVMKTDESQPERIVLVKNQNNQFLLKLNVRFSENGTPFYWNVESYKGEELHFLLNDSELEFEQADEEAVVTNDYRPMVHYTPKNGWLNDPNGLICKDGVYHAFCQHNPISTVWGNMHWYHSTSKDLLHWERHGDALFPDEMGTMFSGSAICDKNNVAGFGKDTILLYYTIAAYDGENPRLFSQGIAYSHDCIHFTKYEHNPVVPNIVGENRDPKVVYVPEMGCYVMALFLVGNEYCMLKSDDLLHWQQFQRLTIPCEGECPDLYYMKESQKWIFSGASDFYVVGHFEKSGFVQEQEPMQFYLPLGERYAYASQSFSGTGDDILKMYWSNINPRNHGFCGQLSIPLKLSLVALPNQKMRLKGEVFHTYEEHFQKPITGTASAYEIPSRAFMVDLKAEHDFSFIVDGQEFEIKDNRLIRNQRSIPISYSGNRQIRMIVDSMSVEILADNGLIFTVEAVLNNQEIRLLEVKGEDVQVEIRY